MRFISLIILVLFYHFSFAQGENNIWYFGGNGGLDFNHTTPIFLTDGQIIKTAKGVCSICNSEGGLLFYSDATTVWNRIHVIMPNGFGLKGNRSSSQGVVIIPKPSFESIYYVFSLDNSGSNGALHYSEIDIKLNENLGDVTEIKNVFLIDNLTRENGGS